MTTHTQMIQEADGRGTHPLLSILIVNYNGLGHLDECLSSIRAQDFHDLEVVLVDNASMDGSRDFVRERFPEVRLFDSGANLGFAGGNNFGLTHCRGEYIFFLNNDTRLDPNALVNLAAAIRAHPDYRGFACLMLTYKDPAVVDNGGETLYRNGLVSGLHGYPAALFDRPREVIGACGGAAVYARALLDETGGFDEDFFLIYEDVDLSLRARHNGDRFLFLPGVRVLHKGSASIGGSLGPTGLYYTTRNNLLFIAKNFPAATLFRCLPGIVFGLASRGLQAARRGRFGIFLRGLRDGALLLPAALRKRRDIMDRSRINRREFERPMRPGWLRDRIDFRKGGKNFVP
jgi:GT2 family glycosyltransferase